MREMDAFREASQTAENTPEGGGEITGEIPCRKRQL